MCDAAELLLLLLVRLLKSRNNKHKLVPFYFSIKILFSVSDSTIKFVIFHFNFKKMFHNRLLLKIMIVDTRSTQHSNKCINLQLFIFFVNILFLYQRAS